MKLVPLPGFVLVRLENQYKNIEATAKVYEASSRGVVVATGDDVTKKLVGHEVYWTEMRAGSPIELEGTSYAFVGRREIQGYLDV